MRAEEIELSVPDGRRVTTLINATPIHGEDGAVASVVVTMQDLAPLQALERMRAEFLGMVSHELRVPLTSIKGSTAATLGAARLVAPAETREFFRIIDDQADRMIGLIADFQDQVIGVRDEEVVHMPKMTGVQYEKKVKAYLKNHLDHIVIHRLRTNQPLTATDLLGLERTLAEIGEDDGQTLLTGLLARSEAPSLAHFVRNMVGMDRAAAQRAFSGFLSDQSLTPPQIRFVEMVIDQLTARGVMEASALYEPPFSNLHAGGPEALFGGKKNVIEGIFDTLKAVQSGLMVKAA